ncbi:formin-like protein 20 [Chiroxiphia lanceolata]|uniref:formin-like protein 20 n=1 Tax=Chiroxiphia lanceolata TaxID=296741 RepID=UPI0013CF34DA|nr:formin-like protein 20 [Chiroxiphia lanceolata]
MPHRRGGGQLRVALCPALPWARRSWHRQQIMASGSADGAGRGGSEATAVGRPVNAGAGGLPPSPPPSPLGSARPAPPEPVTGGAAPDACARPRPRPSRGAARASRETRGARGLAMPRRPRGVKAGKGPARAWSGGKGAREGREEESLGIRASGDASRSCLYLPLLAALMVSIRVYSKCGLLSFVGIVLEDK